MYQNSFISTIEVFVLSELFSQAILFSGYFQDISLFYHIQDIYRTWKMYLLFSRFQRCLMTPEKREEKINRMDNNWYRYCIDTSGFVCFWPRGPQNGDNTASINTQFCQNSSFVSYIELTEMAFILCGWLLQMREMHMVYSFTMKTNSKQIYNRWHIRWRNPC